MSFTSVEIDFSQVRPTADDMQSTLVSGFDWDPGTVDGVWVEPSTHTAMILPAVLKPEWTTTNSGIYQKFALGDLLDLTDSSGWTEFEVDSGGKHYRYGKQNTAGLTGYVNLGVINAPMVVEVFLDQATPSTQGAFECGWSSWAGEGVQGGISGDISLRYFAEGRMEVWNDVIKLGEGTLNAKKDAAEAILGNQGAAVQSGYVTLLLIPCRDRELLVASTAGGCFSHVFSDLDEAAGNTIVPGNVFWFRVPTGLSCQGLRISKMQFLSTGTIKGRASSWWTEKPETAGVYTGVQSMVFRDKGTAGTVTLLVKKPGAPGLQFPVQLEFSLSSATDALGRTRTPFLYGGRAWYDSATDSTADSVQDITAAVQALSVDVPDQVGGITCRATVRLGAVDPSLHVDSMLDRPFRVSGSANIFEGMGGPAQATMMRSMNDLSDTAELEAVSLYKLAEDYRYSDPVPLDGLTLKQAFERICLDCSLPCYITSAASSINLGDAGVKRVSQNDSFNMCVEVNDTAAQWITRLFETFVPNWHIGMGTLSEGPFRLEILDPASMPSSPAKVLYATIQDALDAEASETDVYWTCVRKVLPPEANIVTVMGLDPRLLRPIIRRYRDTASGDPTTAVGDRAATWRGRPLKYAWMDPGLTTVALVEGALEKIVERVTVTREMFEITAPRFDQLQRGSVILLKNTRWGDVQCRVKSWGAEFEMVGNAEYPGFPVRETAHYVCEMGSSAAPIGVPGSRLHEIEANWHQKQLVSPNRWSDIAKHYLLRLPNAYEVS